MEKIRLEIYDNGKIRCFGTTSENFELLDQEGKAIPHGNPFTLCGYGKSQKTRSVIANTKKFKYYHFCLLYTSDAADE